MMYQNAYLLLKKYLHWQKPPEETQILEVGAGKRYHESVLYNITKEEGWKYNFCDLRNYHVGTPGYVEMTNENTIFSPPGVFDIVGCTQVIEHVAKPWLWILELARVCKLGGLVVMVGPITWSYHKNPIDCWRILPDGMRVLMAEAKLELLACSMECLDQTPDIARHHFNLTSAPHWDCIAIGRKPLGTP